MKAPSGMAQAAGEGQPSTVVAPSAQPVRMLTGDEVWAVWSEGRAPGPVRHAANIQRKFCEINGLAIGATDAREEASNATGTAAQSGDKPWLK